MIACSARCLYVWWIVSISCISSLSGFSRHQECVHALEGRPRGISIRLCRRNVCETATYDRLVDILGGLDFEIVCKLWSVKEEASQLKCRKSVLRSTGLTYNHHRKINTALPEPHQPTDLCPWSRPTRSLVTCRP